MSHTRRRIRLDVFGQKLSFPEFAEVAGISEGALRQRVTAGWTIDDILKTPIVPLPPRLQLGEVFDDRTIMAHAPSGTSGERRVICQCICGKTVIIKEMDLRGGRRTFCVCKKGRGSLSAGSILPGSGAIVLELVFAIPNRSGLGAQVWRCKCPCGKKFKENGRELFEGHRVWCSMQCEKKREHKQNVMRRVRERFVKRVQVGDEFLTLREVAARTQVKPDAVRYRLRKGMPIDQVIGPRLRSRPRPKNDGHTIELPPSK